MSKEADTPTESTTASTPANKGSQSTLLMIGAGLVVFLTVIVIALLLQRSGGKGTTGNAPADVLALLNGADEQIDSARAKLAGIENSNLTLRAQLDAALAQIDNLQKTQAALGAQAGEAATLRGQIATLESEIKTLQERLASSKVLLDSARDQASESAKLIAALEEKAARLPVLEAQVKDLTEQREMLRKRLEGAVGAAELAEVENRLRKALSEIEALRLEKQKLQAQLDRSRLYVEDSGQLSPLAAALFVELEKLEGTTPDGLRDAYKLIEKNINARRIDLLAFETGSAAVDTGRVGRITRDIAEANEKSFFLVVGYASKSGDSASNRSLSARRATAVASIVDSLKRPGNKVQAVYLGETNRFSAESLPRNQVCEIWEIKPIARPE